MALRRAQGDYYGAHTQAIQQNAETARQRANTYQQSVTQKTVPRDTIQTLNAELKDYGPPAKILGPLAKDPNGAAYRGDVQRINGQEVWVPNPNGGLFSPDAQKPIPEDKGGMFGWGAHPAHPQ